MSRTPARRLALICVATLPRLRVGLVWFGPIILSAAVIGLWAWRAADRADGQQPAKRPEAKLPAEADLAGELPRIAPREPAEAAKTFQIVPGFRLELVAAEPLLASPVALSFDERGRMYVACMRGYSENADELLGEIRLLEDADGDGRFEKDTVFADKLSWPTAVICYDGGVYVGNAPDLLYLKDTNGDRRADVRRRPSSPALAPATCRGCSTRSAGGWITAFTGPAAARAAT